MMMRHLFPVLYTILLLVQAVSLVHAQNCPHGLSSMDIAEGSNQNLTGKVALVTGGRSGLGYAIAQALVSRGCQVVIASRNDTLNEQAVASLNMNGTGSVSYKTFDLESFASVRAFATQFQEQHDRLDFYFGNAGQGDFGPQPITEDGYERIFQVNYVSQVLLVELLLPLMRKTDSPSRILLTGSNSHTQACGVLGMDGQCWADDTRALATLPFDRTGLEALNYTFDCPPLAGTYPITKYLMTVLAQSISKHEKLSGNQVYAYAWAPGNIHTDLNQWAMCCFAPPPDIEVDTDDQCRFQLPYVGPKDADGNPNPPMVPEVNHWVSPAHGTMAPIYAALVAPVQEAGYFYATYWECEPDQGFTPLGITDDVTEEIYERSKTWAGIVVEEKDEDEEVVEDDEEEEEKEEEILMTNSTDDSIASSASLLRLGLSSAMAAGLLTAVIV